MIKCGRADKCEYDECVFVDWTQLWTMYCESLAALSFTDTESYINAHQTVMDFWGRVTPGILQLLSHSKVVRLLSSTPCLKKKQSKLFLA